ncbi:uncharacterized protein TNCV_3188361 [Trichonephila clavipes]|nr:uncharacterized protein TNCV_3188361 [Trichonephila clavipes]
MTEMNLIQHIVSRLEPQVQNYVEVRNPSTRAQLLQVISKFDEKYSSRETQGSRTNYNMERRDWDMLRMFTKDRRNRNWRNADDLDQQNDKRDNYRSTYGNVPQRNHLLQNRNRFGRNTHGFDISNGRYQSRNRGSSENFN